METNDRIRVLYIEGFSPGPGLPDPLLDKRMFEVYTARMPYGCNDIFLRNPFIILIVLCSVAFVYVSATLDNIEFKILWIFLLFLGWALACFKFKRFAVGYCLDTCIATYADVIRTHKIDVLIGYSWGGGIASALLNRNIWEGGTLLIAPAGEQMFRHAGRLPPTLRKGHISNRSKVITVQGDRDEVVGLGEVQRLHACCDEGQCELIIARNGSHFLERTVTSKSLQEWCRDLAQKT
jgi:hypothetical protein